MWIDSKVSKVETYGFQKLMNNWLLLMTNFETSQMIKSFVYIALLQVTLAAAFVGKYYVQTFSW